MKDRQHGDLLTIAGHDINDTVVSVKHLTDCLVVNLWNNPA